MKKILAFFFLFFSVGFLLQSQTSVRLGFLKEIACAPCAYLIENKEKLTLQNISFKIFESPQSELPQLLKNEIDIAFLAPENAAKVFEKTDGAIIALGIVQNSNLCLFTNSETYASVENLKGETVICPSETREIILLKKFLAQKGISFSEKRSNSSEIENSVILDFSVPLSNIANNLILGKSKFALLSEPYATVATKNSSKIIRVEKITENDSSTPVLLLVASEKFVSKNRATINKFIDIYKQATEWTLKNQSKASILCEKYMKGQKANILRLSIPASNITFRNALAGKSDIENLLNFFLEYSPETIGSKIPSDDFYFR